MCRVTIGHLRVTIGHLRVTIGHLRVTIGLLRAIMGHLFLQQEFSSEINVTDIFGIKFEANDPVKINIVKPLNVAKEEDSEELYTCKYCNKSFSRVYHLNRQ